MQQYDSHNLVAHFFRHESTRLTSTLAKLFGLPNLQIAEDISQEAMLDALTSWPVHGIPDNPKAWLYRVAKNKAIDILKRKEKLNKIVDTIAKQEDRIERDVAFFFLEDEIRDNQLQMLFACCHPAVPEDGQVMFMLKALCGLSVSEIADAYLCGNEAVEKRIYRVKEKLKEENIQLTMPSPAELQVRLDAVLRAIYLLFNEGYNSSKAVLIIRKEVCDEAMRLCVLLLEMPLTNLPFTNALMALMCYQSSRFDARLTEDGDIITFAKQDRSKWNQASIERGHYYLSLSITKEILGKYQVEAAIAYWYCIADNVDKTNWQEIFNLYNLLVQFDNSPVIKLNRLIVQSKLSGYRVVLPLLLQLEGLEKKYLYYSTLGECYQQLNESILAIENYEKAIRLTSSDSEKKLLRFKIKLCMEVE